MTARLPGRRGSGSFVIPYLRVELSPLTKLVPAAEVRLSWKGRASVVWMLVDTGSTVSVIPPTVAEELGLELVEAPHPVKGMGGDVRVRSTRAHAQLVSPDTTVRLGRSWLLDPLLVVPRDDSIPIPLLGRKPFLEHHELTVREDRTELVLRELPG